MPNDPCFIAVLTFPWTGIMILETFYHLLYAVLEDILNYLFEVAAFSRNFVFLISLLSIKLYIHILNQFIPQFTNLSHYHPPDDKSYQSMFHLIQSI